MPAGNSVIISFSFFPSRWGFGSLLSRRVLADRDSAHAERTEDVTPPDSASERKTPVNKQQVSDCNISLWKRYSLMLFYSEGIQETQDQSAAAKNWPPFEYPDWCILVYLAFALVITRERYISAHFLVFIRQPYTLRGCFGMYIFPQEQR